MPAPRICPHCDTVNDPNVTFCGACATQLVRTTAIVPVNKRSLLPVLNTQQKATLGTVVVGAVAVAVRVGTELLRQTARAPSKPLQPTRAGRAENDNTIVVRRRWITGDGSGHLRWGEEEIEIERPNGDETSYTIKF